MEDTPQIEDLWIAEIRGRQIVVKIERTCPQGGWFCENLNTRRLIRVEESKLLRRISERR